jgi:glycosyltransferase involved in cell wall biosynthesis
MKVSVITITHNRAHLIGETIKSVLDQAWTDFEHIIIDDGSTDETENVVKSFNDSRIRYYKYDKQERRSFIRNEGIRKATGALISIVDSDDLWMKDKLKIIVDLFTTHPEVGFAIHDLAFVSDRKIIREHFFPYKNGLIPDFLSDLLNNRVLPYSIYTVSKTALDDIGLFDESMIDGQQDLYFRAASRLKVFYSENVLAHIQKHSGNISAKNDLRHYEDYLKSIGKLHRDGFFSNSQYRIYKSGIYRKLGYLYRHERRYKSSFYCYLKSVKAKYFRQ